MSIYEGYGKGKRPSGLPWWGKLIVAVAILTLIAMIGGMSYLVKAKYRMNDYVIRLGNSLNAAMLVNATETHTDPEKALVTEYEGQRIIISPDNYKALQSYLRRDHAMPMFGRVDKASALHVTICGESHLYITGDKNGDGATILFETPDDSFLMHVTGGDLWEKIVDICTRGTYKYPNIPL